MAAIRIQTGLRMHQARRTAQGLREARVQTTAVTFLQSYMRGAATRSAMPRLQKQALEEKARRYTAAQMIQEQHRRKHPPAPGSGVAAGGAFDDTPLPAADAFVIRNLDTGEAVSLELGAEEGAQDKDLKLSFGTLQQNPQAWEALKSDSKGLLEKLASSTTISFRSYQLCVWQERYVYASDEALCYQHLSADMQPTGAVKTIPYSSIEFVGPFDEQQFVVKCKGRAFTFMCDTLEGRTRWIKNISLLAGCSASTEVCHKTTTMGP